MHIAIDARIIRSSTGTVVERLLHHLQAIDRDNRYTILIDRNDDAFWQPTAGNFSKLLVSVPNHSVAEQLSLRRTLAALRPDLIHFCAPQQPIFTRWRKVTTIYDLTILRTRNPRKGRLASLAKRMTGWVAFRRAAVESDRIIVMSDFTRRDIVGHLGVSPDKINVIYGAADRGTGIGRPYDVPFQRYLLYVGRHPAYKNLTALCDAHQRLRDRWSDLGLVFVGRVDDEAEATRHYCQVRGYRDVHFTGFLADDQRDWLYGRAAAYVFPSFAEGFGLPGLEAMIHGAPVVSSNATCLPEIYGDAALYFDPADTGAMTDAIARVLGDDDLRRDLIERGYDRAERFSWRRMAEETLALYEKAVAA